MHGDCMSFKDNYLELSKRISGGPYSLEKKGISRGSIDSIKRGSMPSADTAYKIAQALGVTVEELFTGANPESYKRPSIKETASIYNEGLPEKDKMCVEELVEILQKCNKDDKKLIQDFINHFYKNSNFKKK